MPQTETKGITLTGAQLQEIRNYLLEQPAKVVNPVLTFLAQLEAEQARQEQEKIAKGQETDPGDVKEAEPVKPRKAK